MTMPRSDLAKFVKFSLCPVQGQLRIPLGLIARRGPRNGIAAQKGERLTAFQKPWTRISAWEELMEEQSVPNSLDEDDDLEKAEVANTSQG